MPFSSIDSDPDYPRECSAMPLTPVQTATARRATEILDAQGYRSRLFRLGSTLWISAAYEGREVGRIDVAADGSLFGRGKRGAMSVAAGLIAEQIRSEQMS